MRRPRMSSVDFVEGVRDLLVPIDRVRQHPDNPNNGDIEALTDSIQVNGFYTAIVADKTTGYILAGNHRYQALLGLKSDVIPVIWTDKQDAAGLRVLLADNITARLARMDREHSLAIMKDLNENTDLGLAGTGMTKDTYEQALMDLANEQNGQGFMKAEPDASLGVFEVTVRFDSLDEREEAYVSLVDHYGEDPVRKTNL